VGMGLTVCKLRLSCRGDDFTVQRQGARFVISKTSAWKKYEKRSKFFSYYFSRQVVLRPIYNSRPTNSNAALELEYNQNKTTIDGWLLINQV
jgi:hypothetical protein